MNNNIYHKMCRKPHFRRFKIFKQKYLNKDGLFALCAKMKLVREVNNNSSIPYLKSDTLAKVNLVNTKIRTDRGVFNLSYFATCNKQVCQWYYESRLLKRKLHEVQNSVTYNISVEVRSECEAFEVHLSPHTSVWVERNNPKISMIANTPRITDKGSVHSKTIICDFSKARLGVKITDSVLSPEEIDDRVRECAQRAKTQIYNYLEANTKALNEVLTGVKADGMPVTYEGCELLPNVLCNKCGRPVFKSALNHYAAQCLFCDEDLYGIEVHKVDPVYYKQVYKYNEVALFDILSKNS